MAEAAKAMSFAERQLAKYGWKKGEGLGKDRTGIKRAITVSRRTDNRGIGSDASQWNSNWWDHLYNKATSNVSTSGQNTPQEEASKSDEAADKEEAEFQAKLAIAAAERDTLSEYRGMFVKSASASANGTPTARSGDSTPTVDSNGSSGPVDRTRLVRDGNVHLGVNISDAELFAACEGRMARKGARAEQNGKLSRVSGDGMPRPEVAAMIEAALNGKLAKSAKSSEKKRKRNKSSEEEKPEKSKKEKKLKKEKKEKKEKKSKHTKSSDKGSSSSSTDSKKHRKDKKKPKSDTS